MSTRGLSRFAYYQREGFNGWLLIFVMFFLFLLMLYFVVLWFLNSEEPTHLLHIKSVINWTLFTSIALKLYLSVRDTWCIEFHPRCFLRVGPKVDFFPREDWVLFVTIAIWEWVVSNEWNCFRVWNFCPKGCLFDQICIKCH